jgi:NADPH:quinone reductase-like Zn-dependent oxidoreductase
MKKGITQDTYGSIDVLEFRDVAEPRVGEQDVLVAPQAIQYVVEGRGRGKVAITI